jgi:hypothetical protein
LSEAGNCVDDYLDKAVEKRADETSPTVSCNGACHPFLPQSASFQLNPVFRVVSENFTPEKLGVPDPLVFTSMIPLGNAMKQLTELTSKLVDDFAMLGALGWRASSPCRLARERIIHRRLYLTLLQLAAQFSVTFGGQRPRPAQPESEHEQHGGHNSVEHGQPQ